MQDQDMMVATPQLGVLIMDDGAEFGERACSDIPRIRPTSVRLALQGAPDRPGIRTVGVVSQDRFTLRTAISAAAAEGLFLIAAPRNVQDPLSVFVDAARGAAGALDSAHPGFALALVEPPFEFQRIAAVADLRDPVTTGLSAWAAVALASRFGTHVDVLVLGADFGDQPVDWEAGMSQFSMRADSQELVRDALQRAVEHGVELRWKPLGSPMDKPAAILRAVVEGGYDLVVDDLPGITVGPRAGRRRRVQAALTQAGSSATAYRLLRDAPCGVVVVLDAARLGLIPVDAARAGAATLALGVVGAGFVSATSAEAPSEAVAAMPVVEEPIAAAAIPEAAPQPDVSAMTEADLAVMQQQLQEAIQARDTAAAELGQQQQELAQTQADLDQAQQQAQSLAPAAEEAREEADAASRDATFKQIMTSGPLSVIPIGPSEEEAEQAQERAEDLEQQADELESALAQWEQTRQELQGSLEDLNEEVAATQQELAASEQEVASLGKTTSDLAWQLNPVAVPVAPGYFISTPYGQAGPYWSSGYHTGLDFAHDNGADVYAAKAGTVVEAGWGGAYGNNIVIQHDDGTRSRYAHLSTMNVSVGATVSAGQHIGDVGATGNVTDPHLHFEALDAAGNFLDPGAWLGIPY